MTRIGGLLLSDALHLNCCAALPPPASVSCGRPTAYQSPPTLLLHAPPTRPLQRLHRTNSEADYLPPPPPSTTLRYCTPTARLLPALQRWCKRERVRSDYAAHPLQSTSLTPSPMPRPHPPLPAAGPSAASEAAATSPAPPASPLPSFNSSSSCFAVRMPTCFSCPPVLLSPAPARPARPRSARARRPSRPPSATRARPSTAPPSLPSAPFRIPNAPRPPSPRSSTPGPLLAWSSSAAHANSSHDDDSSPSSYRSCTSTYFLSPPGCHPRPASTQSLQWQTSSSLAFSPPPSSPSPPPLSQHHARYQADYSFDRSYANLFPAASPTDYHTTTHSLHAHPPAFRSPQAERLIGQWQPLLRNGNELVDPVVQHSKFRRPVFTH